MIASGLTMVVEFIGNSQMRISTVSSSKICCQMKCFTFSNTDSFERKMAGVFRIGLQRLSRISLEALLIYPVVMFLKSDELSYGSKGKS